MYGIKLIDENIKTILHTYPQVKMKELIKELLKARSAEDTRYFINTYVTKAGYDTEAWAVVSEYYFNTHFDYDHAGIASHFVLVGHKV